MVEIRPLTERKMTVLLPCLKVCAWRIVHDGDACAYAMGASSSSSKIVVDIEPETDKNSIILGLVAHRRRVKCTRWGGLCSGRAAPVHFRDTPKAHRNAPRDASSSPRGPPISSFAFSCANASSRTCN
eukprot:449531-Amphidinium_carterae.1